MKVVRDNLGENQKYPLQIIKNKLIDRLWFGTFIIAVIGAPASILRSISTGWLNLYSIHLIFAILVSIVFVYRKKLSFVIKSHLLIFLFAFIGILGVFSLGLLGAGVWGLIMSCFLVSTLYSFKYGTLAVFLSTIIVVVAGYCFSNGIITLPIDANTYVKNYTSWVTFLVATSIMPFFVFQSISSFQYATISMFNEVERQRKHIENMAKHDQLTGLFLLEPANERLNEAMNDARQSNNKVALLFFDIDGFKAVNDEFGHDAGDRILKIIAKRMLSLIRETDTAARIGGDEIIIILSEIKDKESTRVIAQNIIDEVAKPFVYLDQSINITASVGISLFPENATNAKLLRKQADMAMYMVKSSGKNGIAFA